MKAPRSWAQLTAASALLYVGTSELLPLAFVFVALVIVGIAHYVWLSLLAADAMLVGKLSGSEKLFQYVVFAASAFLVILGLISDLNVMAVLSVTVTVLANAAISRRNDLTYAIIASLGSCVLVLGIHPQLAPTPFLIATWVCWIVTFMLTGTLSDHAETTGRRTRRWGQAQSSSPHCRRARRAGRPIAFSLVAAVLSYLLIPVGSGGSSSMRTLDQMFGRGGAIRARDYRSGPMDLNARGDLGTQPLIYVPADSPWHWRSGVLSRYDGRRFYPAYGPRQAPISRLPDGLDVTDLVANGDAGSGPVVAYAVEPIDMTLPLIAPGHLRTIAPRDTDLRTYQGYILLRNSAAGGYTVRVRPTPAAIDSAPSSATLIRGDSPDNAEWLSLPTGVTERTAALARSLTQGSRTRAEKVAAVETYLRSQYHYNLSAPTAPAGRDAVDYFLFDSKQGFCEHFAAAEVVLLRLLGIPARVAVGYGGGKLAPDHPGMRLISADNAHAWVEVYQPGEGWLTSDSTPGTVTSGGRSITESIRALADDVLASPWKRILVAVLVLLGCAAVTFLARVLRTLRRRRGTPVVAAGSDLDAAMRRLRVALDRVGTPVRDDETVRELGGRLVAARQPLLVVERDSYARKPVATQEQLRAADELDVISGRLLAQAEASRTASARAARRG